MRIPTILNFFGTASLVLARSPRHVGKRDFQKPASMLEARQQELPQYSQNQNQKRHMVWIEQPVGTGFSQGKPTAVNEDEVAEQFLGFFKNFVDTFALQGRKVFITGESYAGYYVPYIANAMLNANDTTYYDVRSIMIYDPSTSTDAVQEQ
ncbi:MAG: hypothetical protein Q9193_005871, partial [Seirophora villosa]